jgi:coenzyme F420-reducing hydrogenase delta subunit
MTCFGVVVLLICSINKKKPRKMNELESKYNQFMLEVANFKNELISSDIIEKVKDKFNGFQVLISQLQD